MTTIKIRKWEIWQTYRKDRGAPPWIKVHRELFNKAKWAGLSDAEKGQLVSIWILAGSKNGEIPSDPEIIKKLCGLDEAPNLQKFIDLDFIEKGCLPDDNQVVTAVPPCGDQVVCAETETETETETEKDFVQINHFEIVWSKYPNKQGKKEAERHYKAHVKTEPDRMDIETALDNYIAYVRGKRETTFPRLEYQNGKTWFNNWREWVNPEYEVPESDEDRRKREFLEKAK